MSARAPASLRALLVCGLIALSVALVATGAITEAPAQAADAAAPAGDDAGEEPKADAGKRLEHSKAAAPIFWLFALMVVGGALFVVTRRNLIAAVMGMVGTFFAIAATYVMLYATFLAAIQVLVYAGAIMVLFVFVIMILNKPEAHWLSTQATVGKVLVVLASLYLLFRIGGVLWDVTPEDPTAGQLPEQVEVMQAHRTADGSFEPAKTADFGSSRALGKTLFRDYLFPFEAISLVLLIAVVGAIAVARPHKPREEQPGAPRPEEEAA